MTDFFKLIIFSLLINGCATPITSNDWYYCEYLCGSHTIEACRTFDGLNCDCEYGGMISVGEPPPDDGEGFEYYLPTVREAIPVPKAVIKSITPESMLVNKAFITSESIRSTLRE